MNRTPRAAIRRRHRIDQSYGVMCDMVQKHLAVVVRRYPTSSSKRMLATPMTFLPLTTSTATVTYNAIAKYIVIDQGTA